jgi:hypothetical protein
MSSIQQQRAAVEQLRREASIKRISVSQAIEDIKVNDQFENDLNCKNLPPPPKKQVAMIVMFLL